MTTLVNEVWTLLEKEYEAYNKQNKNFTANLTDEKKQAFHDLCDKTTILFFLPTKCISFLLT